MAKLEVTNFPFKKDKNDSKIQQIHIDIKPWIGSLTNLVNTLNSFFHRSKVIWVRNLEICLALTLVTLVNQKL